MHSNDFIADLYSFDDNYSRMTGPGIELMTEWDKKAAERIQRKKEKMRESEMRELQALFNADNSSVNSETSSNYRNMNNIQNHGTENLSTKSHTGSVRDLGGRMSSAVIDDVAAQIDRNYMQQYMEHHNNSTKK